MAKVEWVHRFVPDAVLLSSDGEESAPPSEVQLFITGFLGLNGAGKTTTIKMLLGMIAPTAGEGTILGHRITDPVDSLRRRDAFPQRWEPSW